MQRLKRNLKPASPVGFRCIHRKLALTVALIGCLSATSVFSQTPPQKPPQTPAEPSSPPNRWLIIVDTSRGMKERAEAARQTAKLLIVSGMSGQMRRGDSLGLWTFNQNLYAGQFPLQECKPETSRVVARRVDDYLAEQQNAKSSRLDKVMSELLPLIKASEHITVILITDGGSKMRGTPFDDKINEAYRNWRDQQKEKQMPFVTLLRATRGEITDYVVHTPPWQLQLPPLPSELQPAAVKAPVKPTPEPQKAPPAALIVSGRKTEPTPATPEPAGKTTTTNVAGATPARIAPVEPAKAQTSPTPMPSSVTPVMAAELSKSNPAPNPPSATPTTPTVASTATPATSPAPSIPETETHPVDQDNRPSVQAGVPGATLMAFLMNGVINSRVLWIVVAVLIMVLLGMMRLRSRRPQSPSRISLITRSLDQEQR